ncbi:oligosaccharide flippase family protein [Paenibacillus sedimenti]|uniref:Oligosaccharide flippase family protein n=1 Tax=Paenibacillus sedimenti TaxID=2770274 RepID=A0A926QIW5_9BACL|nr:oligosaccharide flippase family protein [Paenibacillus sedimenti]MBD0379767.1 oligosaccharide flippase family protein [Paenibacillus sedimenti]
MDKKTLMNKVLSGGGWALTGKLIFAAASLLINAMLSRLLQPQELGTYFIAFNIAFFGSIVGMLGLNQSIVKFLAENRRLAKYREMQRAVQLVIGIALLGGAAIFVLYISFQHFLNLNLFHSPLLEQLAVPIAIWILCNMFQQLLAESFRGLDDIRFATIFGGLLSNLLLVAALSRYFFTGHPVLSDVIFLVNLSILLSIAISLGALIKKLRNLPTAPGQRSTVPHTAEAKRILAISLPIMVSAVTLFFLTSSDIWILGVFRDSDEVAVYGAATRLIALIALCEIVSNSVLPSLIVTMNTKETLPQLQKLGRIVTTISLLPAAAILFIFMLLGPWILGTIFGSFYQQGYWVLILLSMGRVINVCGGANGLLMTLAGYQKTLMYITLITSIITVIASILTVSSLGAHGLAAVMLVGLGLQNVFMWIWVKKKMGIVIHPDFPLLIDEARTYLDKKRAQNVTNVN